MANAGFIFMGGRPKSGRRPPAKSVNEWLLNKKNDSPIGVELAKRKATWSREEGNRAGIEVMTEDLVKSAARNGQELSRDAARAEVVKIADRVDAKRSRK